MMLYEHHVYIPISKHIFRAPGVMIRGIQISFAQLRWFHNTYITRRTILKTYTDDAIKWKYFPRFWPFVRGIHHWQMTQVFEIFLDLRLNKSLSKQSWGWWFETPLRSLWRHCNAPKYPRPLFNKKTLSYGCSNPNIYLIRASRRPSQVYNGNPFTNKTMPF